MEASCSPNLSFSPFTDGLTGGNSSIIDLFFCRSERIDGFGKTYENENYFGRSNSLTGSQVALP